MSIFDTAEKHGWQDDYGRWNFNDDGLEDFVHEVRDEQMLRAVLRAIQEERYATAEVVLRTMLKDRLDQPVKAIYKEVIDSSYPDGDGYWKDTKENVA
jgi:hypothetical protein